MRLVAFLALRKSQQEVLVILSRVDDRDIIVELKLINSRKQGKLLNPWLGHTPRQTVMECLASSQH